MTAGFPWGSPDRPRRAPALPDLRPDTPLLTVAARPVPPDAIVLAVRGEVDISTTSLLQNALLAHLRDAVPQVVVDLTAVDFLGAAGLAVLVNVREAAVTAGSSLCLIARTRVVLRPLTITGLDGVFDIYPELPGTPPVPGGGPDA